MAKARTKKQNIDLGIEYSPTAVKTFHFCQKKFYFTWLARRKQGWRKPSNHPWHQIYRLKQLKHRQAWAGDLYHQVMAFLLNHIRSGQLLSANQLRLIAKNLAAAQFEFSSNRSFITATKSHVPTYYGMSTFLALFDHAYNLPTNNLLQETQHKIDTWLCNTFSWSEWPQLVNQVKQARVLYIEPQNLTYSIGGVRISARMDLGFTNSSNDFVLYDWKCYGTNDEFTEYNQRSFKHQLLVYALWPVLGSKTPISIDRVVAHVFNPLSSAEQEVHFTNEDLADFELEANRWGHIQNRLFTDIPDIEFDDLEGPYDSQRSCPWCPFKAVCGEEIVWHQLS